MHLAFYSFLLNLFSFRQILPAIGPFLRRGCKYVCPAVRIVANAATTVYSGTTSGTYTPVRSVSNFSSSCLRLQFLIFFGFAFDLVAVVVTSFCVGVPHFMHIGPVTTHSGDDVLSILDGSRGGAIPVLLSVCDVTLVRIIITVNLYSAFFCKRTPTALRVLA